MSARISLRASDFSSPEQAARRLTQVLNDLQRQLAPRRLLVDLDITTTGAGAAPPININPPAWPVKAVVQVHAWDASHDVPAWVRTTWRYVGGKLSIEVNTADISPLTRYLLRLELSGE